MSDVAIKVENLGKRYRIGKKQEKYRTISSSINNFLTSPFRNFKRLQSLSKFKEEEAEDVIWALKDVNFEVKKGEAIGIIGRNGAGKSTLLKILSRITEPTTGRIEVNGRVASLLEVGTGFNPELTGRENIYLNGAILGMTKREIIGKFDEIVDFSGVEKFIDTPVKRYSSGMYVRLAFAVAAHLEPEILVIDEVLAVGDAEFQKKCLGKMGKVAKEGRTVLFVSHNMQAIQSLCTEVILLENGYLKLKGATNEVINNYLFKSTINKLEQTWDLDDMPGNDLIKVKLVKVISKNDEVTVMDVTTPIDIIIDFINLVHKQKINVSLVLKNIKGEPIFNDSTPVKMLNEGLHRAIIHIPGNFLNDDIYTIDYYFVKDSSTAIYIQNEPITFEIQDVPRADSAWYGKWIGAVRPRFNWEYYEI